jgi:WD40 repeat protein
MGSVSDDMTLKLWSMPGGILKNSFTNKTAGECITFSPDSKLIALGFSDRTVRLFSSSEARQIKTTSEHSGVIRSVAFSPDGKTLASGSDDETIRLWSVPDLKLIKRLYNHSESVNCLAFSPDGKFLASASNDETIRLHLMPECETVWCLYDPDTVNSGTDAISYKEMSGEIITVPCGTPIPAGAICICDCVASSVNYRSSKSICVCNTITVAAGTPLPAGAVCVCNTVAVGNYVPEGHSRTYEGTVCSCNTVCTCDTVCTCQGVGSHYWYPC